jgi:aspartate aminotransferase-like enzyme
MGESSKQENIITLLSALEKILPEVGYEVAVGSGVKAAEDALASS